MRYFIYYQNNSGGYYDGPQVLIIRARTEKSANNKLIKSPYYHTKYCSCCGQRWYPIAKAVYSTDAEAYASVPDRDRYGQLNVSILIK